MKNILIPTDFSENAWNAISYALAYFKDQNVNFVLVHILPQNVFPPTLETLRCYITGEMLVGNKVMVNLENNRNAILKTGLIKDLYISVDYVEVPFIEGMKQLIEKHAIDLIVMGTQGFSADKNKIIGKHVQSVITKIQCPVLVIPEKAKFTTPVNIAFPTDYNFIYKNKVLNTLSTTANLHNASIKIIRIVNPKVSLTDFQYKNRGYLKAYFKATKTSFHKVNHTNFHEGLQEFIDSMQIDMISIIAKNLNFFEMLFFKHKVIKMSYHTKIPFLVLHE